MTANTQINFNNHFGIELSGLGSRFITINGNKSSYTLYTLNADINANIINRLSIAVGLGRYTLNGYYEGFRNVSQIFPFAHFSVGYRL
ncbi:hypothetical protein [Pedobacter sp.]|uniref:hypothetical protein n=1 Tax=Pedobacter sp. TaxID=1411316 RepID=UPI003D7F4561